MLITLVFLFVDCSVISHQVRAVINSDEDINGSKALCFIHSVVHQNEYRENKYHRDVLKQTRIVHDRSVLIAGSTKGSELAISGIHNPMFTSFALSPTTPVASCRCHLQPADALTKNRTSNSQLSIRACPLHVYAYTH